MRFLSAEWRKLIMANYEAPAALLKPFFPPHTELGDYNGKHFVSLVEFMFLETTLLGLS